MPITHTNKQIHTHVTRIYFLLLNYYFSRANSDGMGWRGFSFGKAQRGGLISQPFFYTTFFLFVSFLDHARYFLILSFSGFCRGLWWAA